MTRKLLWFLLLGALMAVFCHDGKAQPNVCFTGQTNTSCPCDVSQTPCIKSYIGSVNTAFASMWNTIASLPQPKIGGATQIPPATASFRNSDTTGCFTPVNRCLYSVATPTATSKGLNAYLDAAVSGAGVTILQYNSDPLYYTQAPQYAGSATPTFPSQMAYQLTVDLAFLTHAVNAGLTLQIAASPLPSTFTSCGLNPATMTAAQAYGCLDPMIAAEIEYLNAHSITVSQFLPWHEPTGYTPLITGQTFTPTEYTSMVNAGCAAIHAATGGASVKCGGGFAAADSAYTTNYYANATADSTVTGLETYGSNNPAAYASNMTTLMGMCTAGRLVGMECHNTEGDPPRHVPTGGSSSESAAYEGCTWSYWQTYGINNSWSELMPKYLAAFGFKDVTRFSSQQFGGLLSDPSKLCFSPTGVGSATNYLMAAATGTTGATAAAIGWASGITWSSTSWQGFTQLSGKVASH